MTTKYIVTGFSGSAFQRLVTVDKGAAYSLLHRLTNGKLKIKHIVH